MLSEHDIYFTRLYIDYKEIIGLVAGVFTSVSLLPQLIKTCKEKDAEGLSLGMMLTLLAGVGLWIYYGIFKSDFPIIITNSVSLIINITLLFFSIKYKKKEA